MESLAFFLSSIQASHRLPDIKLPHYPGSEGGMKTIKPFIQRPLNTIHFFECRSNEQMGESDETRQ